MITIDHMKDEQGCDEIIGKVNDRIVISISNSRGYWKVLESTSLLRRKKNENRRIYS